MGYEGEGGQGAYGSTTLMGDPFNRTRPLPGVTSATAVAVFCSMTMKRGMKKHGRGSKLSDVAIWIGL